jgi:hypothetical protein
MEPYAPHVFDTLMAPPAPARRQTSPDTERKWQMSAVYVDDFTLPAVEDPTGTLLQHTGRAALHTIHGLFPPPERSGHLSGKDPISTKKLEAGDGRWALTKELFGFVCNGEDRTVHLTQRKAAGIADDTAKIIKKNHVTLPKFQSVVGKMRHVTTILPTARRMLTLLN